VIPDGVLMDVPSTMSRERLTRTIAQPQHVTFNKPDRVVS
jgi:hypothetical protein